MSRSKLVRIYLSNLTEFDLINSFHLHADFFRYQPNGTGDDWEYTDTVMQCQGQRGVIELTFANEGMFMFHAHQSEFAELGWMGFFNVVAVMEARAARLGRGIGWRLWALGPIVLLALVVALFATTGSSLVELIGRNPPPADEFDVRRVEFRPGEIRVRVTNPQREDLTVASVTVDDAIVPYALDGPATLGRLRSTTIVVPFDWVEDDPIAVGVTSSTGIETVEEIPAAVETARPSARGFLGYGVIGLLVGVVPVALGLLWLPSLRRADERWLSAFMALTGGLLTFLGVEALFEAFELQAVLPGGLGGPGLVVLGVALSYLTMTLVSSRLGGASGATGFALALLVALGIGLHNFGEGLAIGSSFAFGQLALGTFLIVGFMVHNVTEGLGIAAPLAEDRKARPRARPARRCWRSSPVRRRSLGAWIGGYVANDVLAVVFFGAAAGAAFEVVVEVGRYVAKRTPGGLGSALGDRRLPRRDRRDVRHRSLGRLSRRRPVGRARSQRAPSRGTRIPTVPKRRSHETATWPARPPNGRARRPRRRQQASYRRGRAPAGGRLHPPGRPKPRTPRQPGEGGGHGGHTGSPVILEVAERVDR